MRGRLSVPGEPLSHREGNHAGTVPDRGSMCKGPEAWRSTCFGRALRLARGALPPFISDPWGPDHVAHGHAETQGGSASGGVETCSLSSAFAPSCSSGCRAEVRDAWWRFPCQSAAGQRVTSVGGWGGGVWLRVGSRPETSRGWSSGV